jgi:hypothetical protein
MHLHAGHATLSLRQELPVSAVAVCAVSFAATRQQIKQKQQQQQ